MAIQLFAIFGCFSLAVIAGFLLYAFYVHKKIKPRAQILPPFWICAMGTFLSVLLIFIPIYYTYYDFGDGHRYIRPLLLAIHNTMRVFILDGEFDIIKDAVAGCPAALRIPFSFYAAILYVAAPAMTFGAVLSLLKDFTGQIRFTLHKGRPFYVMSKLNQQSVALAKDIVDRYNIANNSREEGHKEKKPIIVFADVTEPDDFDYDLILDARDLRAICLKKDISHLSYKGKEEKVELFLIGEDESENVSQAVGLVEEFKRLGRKEATNKKVFVFARSASSEHILNSLNYGERKVHYMDKGKEKVKYEISYEDKGKRSECILFTRDDPEAYEENAFKLRRINDIRQLAWNKVPELYLYPTDEGDTISVLLVGMGEHSLEFFKAILWYCQVGGYRLELNVIDKDAGTESRIRRLCPGLLDNNPCEEDGLAHYDIRFFSGVDMETDSFRKLIEYKGHDKGDLDTAERLKKTTAAIVALGDDDRNIEVSIYLREIFDRVHKVTIAETDDRKPNDESPRIYSIVYNDKKADILNKGGRGIDGKDDLSYLINYRGVPYNISFFGSISEQYTYENIYDAKTEEDAFCQHIGWESIAGSGAGGAKDAERCETIRQGIARFEKFEYFRLSTIAREIYYKRSKKSSGPRGSICHSCRKYRTAECESSDEELLEHVRWCVYMLINGYTQSDHRADRAKLHTAIKPCLELLFEERRKDQRCSSDEDKADKGAQDSRSKADENN